MEANVTEHLTFCFYDLAGDIGALIHAQSQLHESTDFLGAQSLEIRRIYLQRTLDYLEQHADELLFWARRLAKLQ